MSAPPDKHTATFSPSEQVVLLTAELNETWRTIHDDVLRMMAVAKQKRVTAQLLHDTVDIDKKKYEILLRQKQPELFSYVTCGLRTSHDCVTALENMRECRREITLAEDLIGDKYSAIISSVPSSSVPQAAPPVKPLVGVKSILPATESRRNKVRERTRKLLIERTGGVRRGEPGMVDDDQEPVARGQGVGRSNVSFGRGRRCALRPDSTAAGSHSLGRGQGYNGGVSRPLPMPPTSAWNKSIPAITWSTAPHWTTTAPPSLTPPSLTPPSLTPHSLNPPSLTPPSLTPPSLNLPISLTLPAWNTSIPPSLTPRTTSRFTSTTNPSSPPPHSASAFSPSTNWVPPMTSQNMLLPCQLPEPAAPDTAPDGLHRSWDFTGMPDVGAPPEVELEEEIDLIPIVTSSTSDL